MRGRDNSVQLIATVAVSVTYFVSDMDLRTLIMCGPFLYHMRLESNVKGWESGPCSRHNVQDMVRIQIFDFLSHKFNKYKRDHLCFKTF